VGEPGGVVTTLPPGAGRDEGDASLQGPAQEEDQAQTLPVQPKPAYADKPAHPDVDAATTIAAASTVIPLAARTAKPKTAAMTAVPREADGLVTVRPKPERRKNAKERAKEKYTKDGTTPETTATAKSAVEMKPTAKTKTKAKKTKAKTSKLAR
jgi:hypothetical protein